MVSNKTSMKTKKVTHVLTGILNGCNNNCNKIETESNEPKLMAHTVSGGTLLMELFRDLFSME